VSAPKLLIIEARFYPELADALAEGAIEEIAARGAEYERISVPGVLELPAAVRYSVGKYDGYVVLGCVIRGETSHYDIVCGESARGLMDLTLQYQLALGNGIQTVENGDQAWDRADKSKKNKGGGAAAAALDMIELKRKFHVALK
jgi:6,7-dimethyl-8-ribityllumazine synthase